ncbi:MAG: hypothetical protein ACM3QZ_01540 [Solirubrobacterales bacterium]
MWKWHRWQSFGFLVFISLFLALFMPGRSLLMAADNTANPIAFSKPAKPGTSVPLSIRSKFGSSLLRIIDAISAGKTGSAIPANGVYLIRAGQSVPGTNAAAKADVVFVYVKIKDKTATSVVNPYAFFVANRDEKQHLTAAWIEVGRLLDLGRLPGVKSITAVQPPAKGASSGGKGLSGTRAPTGVRAPSGLRNW